MLQVGTTGIEEEDERLKKSCFTHDDDTGLYSKLKEADIIIVIIIIIIVIIAVVNWSHGAVLHGMLVVEQSDKAFHSFYEVQMFITVFARVRLWYPSCEGRIHSTHTLLPYGSY
jgi:hypothetical protein